MKGRFDDLTGRTFGWLRCVERAPNDGQYTRWKCVCFGCGGTHIARSHDLKKGDVASCGCLRRDHAPSRFVHGHADSYEHNLWLRLKKRADVCVLWRDFAAFLNDIGRRPSNRHWFFKKDSAQPFGPDNFVWKQIRARKGDAF